MEALGHCPDTSDQKLPLDEGDLGGKCVFTLSAKIRSLVYIVNHVAQTSISSIRTKYKDLMNRFEHGYFKTIKWPYGTI